MNELLLWIYLCNLVFLMMHETDAAYWKEWQLIGRFGASLSDKMGLNIFLAARIPIFVPLLYGLVNLEHRSGLILSLIMSGFLIFHFFLHMAILRRGSDKFRSAISYIIQSGMLALSLVQLPLTVYRLS